MFKAPDHMEWSQNPHLIAEKSAPLEERMAAQRPEMFQDLQRLKEILGEKRFAAYINRLHNINRSGTTLLITAGDEMLRTHVERECLPALKEAFGVRVVRIVSMR